MPQNDKDGLDLHVSVELQFGSDAIFVEGPQDFVEAKVREFMYAIGKTAAVHGHGASEAAMLVKHPNRLRGLYQKHGSTKQWENVVLFVHYFQNVEDKDAVTYDDIRRAYKALGIKAPNVQASANSLKFNLKLLQKVRRGAVSLTSKGEDHVSQLLSGQKPARPGSKKTKKSTAKKKSTTTAKKKKKKTGGRKKAKTGK